MSNFWNSLPTWLRAILIGFVFLIPIVTLIQLAIFRNVVLLAEIPWSAILTICLLGLYWQFTSGKQYPFGKSLFRERYSGTKSTTPLRISNIGKIGISLVLFVFAVTSIGFAFFSPEETVQFETLQQIGTAPKQTVIFLYLALALTAGIVEEIVFRGYVQNMIIEKYGLKIAFVFVGVLFTLVHFLPIELYLPYFIVSLAFSWVAYATGSAIVGIVAHATFDFVVFLFLYYDMIYVSPDHLESNIPLNILIAIVTALIMWREGTQLMNTKNHKVDFSTGTD